MSVTGVESSGRRVEKVQNERRAEEAEQLSSAVEVKRTNGHVALRNQDEVKTWTLQPDKPGHIPDCYD